MLVLGANTAPALVASTVVPMSLETLADHAGQVIVGTVVGTRSYFIDSPRGIETEMTVAGVEYLKGRLTDSTAEVTLRLPGGTVGDMQMRICCAPVPQIGEKWILFLLPTYRTYPTVGLFQGAFRVVTDATGVERIFRGVDEPVTGFDADGMIQVNGAAPLDRHVHRVGTDASATRAAVTATVNAMTLSDFRTLLAPILTASKPHALAAPAGQRVSTPYRTGVMRYSGGTTANDQTGSSTRARTLIRRSKPSHRARTVPAERTP